jgi:hypothetical protein
LSTSHATRATPSRGNGKLDLKKAKALLDELHA